MSRTAPDENVGSTVALLDQLFSPPRPFAVRLWDGTELPGSAGACLVLRHPGALRRMLTPPLELSLGEAFIYGDFDIEGDIFAVFPAMDTFTSRSFSPSEIASLARQYLSLPHSDEERLRGRGAARLRGHVHSRSRDRAAIQYHYDVGNDYYCLWLDLHMQYSCAYFGDGTEDLDTAQERKLEHICRKLRLQPGERLLDVGCGWGGLILYAARHYDVQALGVTLSKKQVSYANEQIARSGLGGQATVQLKDYREIEAGTFDKVVSVGMFEHVGRSKLPEYFAQVHRLLKAGGLFLNHGISRRAPRLYYIEGEAKSGSSPDLSTARPSTWRKFVEERILGTGLFTQRYVFPDGELMPVSEVNMAAEKAGFEVCDVENLREHYALTLRHWVKRLEARQKEAIALADEVTYRTWRLYMAGSAHGFSSGRINVNQTLLAKLDAGRSDLPLTRDDLYA